LIGVRGIDEIDEDKATLEGHVVLVGFGLAGKFAARALETCERQFIALELNAENVRAGKALGLPVYYGDATSDEALGHAHVSSARLLVILINDPQAAQRVVDTAKRVAPHVPILLRTHYFLERNLFAAMGVHDVVAEEVEGAATVIAHMLERVGVATPLIEASVDVLRHATRTDDSVRPKP
jgi:CPA2 family monovalent cation:H+ antiporter-2